MAERSFDVVVVGAGPVGEVAAGSPVGERLYANGDANVAEVPLERLVHAVPSFPTRSEIWLRLLEAYGL